ncbi:hypothetical protein WNY78_08800 [Psychroserpens sp. AS72]|uniref:hypothetical protein n=1 Tax=Psychroserpens sp. AS72 TaxID=3135775 RepID=UPI00317711A9
MKKIVFILVLAITLQVSAQEQSQWLTDNSTALKLSETQNKPILVYVTNTPKADVSAELKTLVNNSNLLDKITSNLILLKLDISDKTSTNVRFGIHYTKQRSAPGLSLIDKYGKTIIEPLVDFSSREKVLTFMTLLNDKL